MKKIFSVLIAIFIVLNIFSILAYAQGYTTQIKAFSYKNYKIPAYDGDGYEILDNNTPHFPKSMLTQEIYESYGSLDNLGRVTVCSANIDKSLMPTKKRGDISSVYPTGWKQNKYDFINNKYLYNRCHLIGWQLTGEGANKNNLMTGTRSFNTPNMLKFENSVADYLKKDSENNVLYRVTPVFQGDNLLATGVILEALSVDDNGESIKFCVFIYNVENGVSIDYSTGENIAVNTLPSIVNAVISIPSCTYTGKEMTPAVTVKYDNNNLICGKDYTITFYDNINAGTAKAKILGINQYSGEVLKSFTIKKASYSPNVLSVKCTYDGKAHSITFKNVKSGSAFKYKTSSTGSYTAKKPTRTAVGKTQVYYLITNPNYTSINSVRTITIIPKNTTGLKLVSGENSFTARWNKYTTQTSGYQLRYSVNSNMASANTVGITSNTTTSKTITKLKANKKYYVQIRTFKKSNGENFFSNWSASVSVSTKK